VFSATFARWVGRNLDAIVLSLDGPPDLQDKHRPGPGKTPAAGPVIRTARILSGGPAELILRACITGQSAARLPEIARWMSREFKPSTVCFESMTPQSGGCAGALRPPDPHEFARGFDEARRVLAAAGIRTVLSTADTSRVQATFCPVGQDALIVTPDGGIQACYLMQQDWRRRGLDLQLGRLGQSGFSIDEHALDRIRRLTVQAKPLCADCFCRHHCCGGCHVNHDTHRRAGDYDAQCIQTRLMTAANLLRGMNCGELASGWLQDRAACLAAVQQPNDRLNAATATHLLLQLPRAGS
jgi:uncharacterized protein